MNPLAVYGTLKNSNIGQSIGVGVLKGGVLVLPEHNMFPAWVDLAPYDDGIDTVVELFEVTNDTLESLDNYEGVHHDFYIRTMKPVEITELSEHGVRYMELRGGYVSRVVNAYVYKAGRVVRGADLVNIELKLKNPEEYIKYMKSEVWKCLTNGNWKGS